jgi:hypothetical protein
MGNKKVGFAVLVLGLVLIVAALAIKFVILPGQAQWPADVDTTRHYEGTFQTIINRQALQSMDLANIFLRDIPVTITRHVTTEKVEGGKAVVLEDATITGPGGLELGSETWYAIDRKTMEAIPDFSGNENIINREGLVIGWPIGSEKKEYTGWNGDTLSTVTLSYVREEERGGLNTYVFEASSPPQEIVAADKLALFPPAVPKDLLVGLAQGLDLPDAMRERFATMLPNLPDSVPLKYTYEYKATYWIEPTTGVLIDTEKDEVRKVALQVEDFPVPVPITAVYDLYYKASASSVEEAAQDAQEAKSTLDTFGTTVPLALIAGGLVLAVVGLILVMRSR